MSGRAYLSSHLDRMLYVHGDHAEGSTLRALAEARAILAETEAECVADWPSMFPQDRGICCAVNEATDALAESLRSFLEA